MESPIDLAIHTRLSTLGKNGPSVAEEQSFYVADLGQIIRQHRRWKLNLPDVHPFYAVKCNPDPTLLKVLAELGTGFDCASIEELRVILSLGVDPSRIIFANPCKTASSLVFARETGVTRTTFDNLDELDTIATHYPSAQLILRIFAEDDDALINFGEKFGAHADTALPLLQRARELRLNVSGVSFHVGTGAQNVAAYVNAIRHAKTVFHQARSLGYHMDFLDIGGGFLDSRPHFETAASVLRETLSSEFPSEVRVIAEPGRYYARSAYTLACKVIARRRQIGHLAKVASDMLYQNDGVYGNFMNVIVEKETMRPSLVVPRAQAKNGKRQSGEHRYSIWGPTCDSVDCVAKEATFPSEIRVGDWLKYDCMGAYTTSTSTQFNGFSNKFDTIYINSESVGYDRLHLSAPGKGASELLHKPIDIDSIRT